MEKGRKGRGVEKGRSEKKGGGKGVNREEGERGGEEDGGTVLKIVLKRRGRSKVEGGDREEQGEGGVEDGREEGGVEKGRKEEAERRREGWW